MSIEDEMFVSALEASKLVCKQEMYEASKYPHKCQMCGDDLAEYRLKPQYVEDLGSETPYIYVCSDCMKDLEV